MKRKALVLGLGDILQQDEGLGVWVIEHLQSNYELPPSVKAHNTAPIGCDPLSIISAFTDVLVVSAMKTGSMPGSIVRLDTGTTWATFMPKPLSPSAVLCEALSTNRNRLETSNLAHLVLWGMEPAIINRGIDLSIIVAAQISSLAAAIARELRKWGYSIALRHGPMQYGSWLHCSLVPSHSAG